MVELIFLTFFLLAFVFLIWMAENFGFMGKLTYKSLFITVPLSLYVLFLFARKVQLL